MDVNGSKGPDDALRDGKAIELLEGPEADDLVDAAPSRAPEPEKLTAAAKAALALAAERFSDTANATRLAGRCAGIAKYCGSLGWLIFNGRKWEVDERDRIIEYAKEVARLNVAEAMEEPDEEAREALVDAARKCLQEPRILAMVALAKSDPRVRIVVNQLDLDPWLLNVENGTLDLRTGVLRPHDPEDLIAKIAPVDYDPAAVCPTWDAFLDRIMGHNAGLIRFLQQAVGYALTGDASEQVLFLLYGTGQNGKTTFLETLTDLFCDYWTKMNTATLLDEKRSAGSASEDVALLAGARLVTAVEIPPGRQLNVSFIKETTGGDTVMARFLYKPSFRFRPVFKAFLAFNQKPTIRDPTEGAWRRVRLIPFNVAIPKEERDRKLPEKLRAELPGILAWAVRGCADWLKNGLSTPPEVIEATATYRVEQDILAGFLADCCVIGDGLEVSTKELGTAYKAWCEASGEEPMSTTLFGRCLTERGFAGARGHRGGRVRKGLALAPATSTTGTASPAPTPPPAPGATGSGSAEPDDPWGDSPSDSDCSPGYETGEL